MSQLSEEYMVILKGVLEKDFVDNLPPLSAQNKKPEDIKTKNISRAFSAFALHKICGITVKEACEAVVDDFDDYGIDAIYYYAPTETVYIVQSKLKASEQFSQVEANAFVQGVRKLIKQDFTGFNELVQKRLKEIEDALDDCKNIVLVVAHTGAGISQHAKTAIDDLLADDSHSEIRLKKDIIDFDAQGVIISLQEAKAYEQIDTDLFVEQWTSIDEPKITHFGLISLGDLVQLHIDYGERLYERNIRTFLGHKTPVNTSIKHSLEIAPQHFVYFNNGVTALCQEIEPKSLKGKKKKLKIVGISVINGAQTIATAAGFLAERKENDISLAKVSVTLIKADSDSEFGKLVTRARNHQNQVTLANFAALDEEQERLRREIAYLGLSYVYKESATDRQRDSTRIRIDEAAYALSILQVDEHYIGLLKSDPSELLNMDSPEYKELFNTEVTSFKVVNAVRFNRYIQKRISEEMANSSGKEKLIYKHGNYVLAWVLAKRIINSIDKASGIEDSTFETKLSLPFDNLRQTLFDEADKVISDGISIPAFFKNQAHINNLLKRVMMRDFGISYDTDEKLKIIEERDSDRFIKYLASKAPKIEI